MYGYALFVLEYERACGESVAYAVSVCSLVLHFLWNARCHLVIPLLMVDIKVSVYKCIPVGLESSEEAGHCCRASYGVEVV